MSVFASPMHLPGHLKSARLPLFASAALVAAIAAPAFASQSCVNPAGRGGCFSTISAAVAAASPGGAIRVAPGTYKEDVVIDKPLSLLGADSRNTIIDATGLANGIHVDGLDNPGLSHVIVSGFTILNANFEGVLLTNASNVILKGNRVADNNKNLSPETQSCPGIPDFETGEAFDCGEGIHLMGVSYSTIIDNVSENNSGGILNSDDTGATHDNLITGNLITENGFACGITLASHAPFGEAPTAPHYGLTHNTIAGNRSIRNGLSSPGAGAGVGIFSNGSGPGRVSGNIVIHNELLENGLPGVAFHSHVGPNFHAPADDLSGNQILFNHIAGNGPDTGDVATSGPTGINVNSGFGGSPITGTVLWGNKIENEAEDIVVNTPAKVDAHFNNLLGGEVGVDNLGGGTVSATQNYWGCFGGPGARGCSTVSGPGVAFVPFLRVPFL